MAAVMTTARSRIAINTPQASRWTRDHRGPAGRPGIPTVVPAAGSAEFEQHRRCHRAPPTRSSAPSPTPRTWCRNRGLCWSDVDRSAVAVPRPFLIKVVSRLAIDSLRLAHRRHETYVGPWLPPARGHRRRAAPRSRRHRRPARHSVGRDPALGHCFAVPRACRVHPPSGVGAAVRGDRRGARPARSPRPPAAPQRLDAPRDRPRPLFHRPRRGPRGGGAVPRDRRTGDRVALPGPLPHTARSGTAAARLRPAATRHRRRAGRPVRYRAARPVPRRRFRGAEVNGARAGGRPSASTGTGARPRSAWAAPASRGCPIGTNCAGSPSGPPPRRSGRR